MVIDERVRPGIEVGAEPARNSFIGFLEEHGTVVSGFCATSTALKNFESQWRNSSQLRTTVEQYIDLVIPASFPAGYSSKVYATYSESLRNLWYKYVLSTETTQERKPGTNDKIIQARKRLNFSQNVILDENMDALDAFRLDYRAGKRELTQQLVPLKKDSLDLFHSHLLQAPSSLDDFATFLVGKEYDSTRQAIRPFLTELAQGELKKSDPKNPSLLNQVRDAKIGREKERIPEEMLGDFQKQILRDAKVMQWMSAFTAANVDCQNPQSPTDDEKQKGISYFLSQVPFAGIWPDELRSMYEELLKKKYDDLLIRVREGLRPFFRAGERERPGGEIFSAEDEKRKRKNETAEAMVHVVSTHETQVIGYRQGGISLDESAKEVHLPEFNAEIDAITMEEEIDWGNLPYEVVRSSSFDGQTTYESYDPRIAAVKRAGNDMMLQRDLDRMNYRTITDPFGPNTKQLVSTFVSAINSRRLPVREFKPVGVPGLVLEHPESHRYRILYAVDKSEEKITIIYRGIYHHNEIDNQQHRRRKK